MMSPDDLATLSFKLGDMVVLNPEFCTPDGNVYEVIELPKGARGVNYRVKNVATGSVTRGRAICFMPANETAKAIVKVVPFQEHLVVGDVVRTVGSRWGKALGELFVVLGSKNDNSWKIAKLGGDEGRYYNSIPRDMIEKVNVKDVLR